MMILVLTVLLTTNSCESEPEGERPELPPAELLFMDYSDFDEEPGMVKGDSGIP